MNARDKQKEKEELLRYQRVVDQALTILRKADNEKRRLTMAEATEIDELRDKAIEIEKQNYYNVNDDWNTRKSAIVDTLSPPGHASPDHFFREPGHDRISGIAKAGRDYRSLHGLDVLGNDGWENISDFYRAVRLGGHDKRLRMETRTMTEKEPTSGGYLVPTEETAWLLDQSLEGEIVRPRAQNWSMTSDTRKVPGWDTSDHSIGLYGGIKGTWLAEAATTTEVDAKTRFIQLTAHKLAVFTRVSNELDQDGLNFESQLRTALVKGIGWYLDEACLRSGTGTGSPLAVLNDPALITVPKTAGQTAGTLTWGNVTRLFARLAPQCFANAVWVANSNTIPQLLTMNQSSGASTDFVAAVTMQNGRFFLLGREVIFTEKLPSLGAKGDIMLIDFSQAVMGLRRELTIDKSQHVGWLNDTSGYRGIIRVDFQGTWNKPITPKNGDTLSWCVCLEART